MDNEKIDIMKSQLQISSIIILAFEGEIFSFHSDISVSYTYI